MCIAIIAILAAILFPVFARAREKARQISCANNLDQIGTALRLYAADNRGRYPPTPNSFEALVPRYLPDRRVVLCPSGTRGFSRIKPPPGQTDYLYRGGLTDEETARTAVAADGSRLRHNGGFNTLFGDGHVKWMSGSTRWGGPGGDAVWKQFDSVRAAKERSRAQTP